MALTKAEEQLMKYLWREEKAFFKALKAAYPEPKPATPAKPLFSNLRKLELMAFGVPAEWVEDVRRATEDTLFDVIEHLPQEAQEALLKLAVGEQPEVPEPQPEIDDPFAPRCKAAFPRPDQC